MFRHVCNRDCTGMCATEIFNSANDLVEKDKGSRNTLCHNHDKQYGCVSR